MGLTAQKSLALENAKLDRFFEKEKTLWEGIAKQAYDYAAPFVKGAAEPVRPDDLIPLLVPVLEVNEKFLIYREENGLRQKYWFTWFAELIIDRVWK